MYGYVHCSGSDDYSEHGFSAGAPGNNEARPRSKRNQASKKAERPLKIYSAKIIFIECTVLPTRSLQA